MPNAASAASLSQLKVAVVCHAGATVQVQELKWGTSTSHVVDLRRPFDVVIACDIMYICDAVQPLLASLRDLSCRQTKVYLAHGRNQQARELFIQAARPHFSIETLAEDLLNENYHCEDVEVLVLSLTL